MIGTITLNPSIDQRMVVEKLIKDDANRALSIDRYPGGKGLNVSKVVRELGGKTCAFALLGGVEGKYWIERVKALDIPSSVLKTDGETRVNTIITDREDGTQTRVSAPGPKISDKTLNIFLKKVLKAKPMYWALGGSLSAGMPQDTYKRFIAILQKKGVPCVLDADNEALRLGIESKPFMIKPNEFEISRLLNKPLKSLDEYAKAACQLHKKGIRIVVISLAKRGALFATAEKIFHVDGIDVEPRSKVGAGDSLIGGFLYGLSQNYTLEKAASLGIAASTSTVMREAPRLCLKKDIPGLLKRIVIHRLS